MATISLTQINRSDDSALSKVQSLYLDAFPPEERRPWEQLSVLIDDLSGLFMMYVATTADGSFAGFITLWHLPGADYVEHFAVDPSMRGSGIGGTIIDNIRRQSGDRALILEVELPQTGPDAPRRIAFYKRHGFEPLNDFTYIQPPYAPGLPQVQLLLMTTRPIADVAAIASQLHTIVYNQ